jgi:hypothetical protein
MDWWIYVIVIGSLIAVYFLSAFILRLITKSAQKKALALYEQVIPNEKKRYELVLNAKKRMEEDGRYLPKNMIESTLEVQKEFERIPPDIAKIKGMDDFLIIYYCKYIKEKKLLEKYSDMEQELQASLYIDPQDKKSPYYLYNKASLKFNSYLNMGFINPFRGGMTRLPTL